MIRASGLGKKFDDTWVFKNISFHIKKGESVGLLGPSGSGKSVLFKILTGLLEPDQGEVVLGSKNIGMLFQKNALFDSLTVEDNLLFPLKEFRGEMGPEAKKKATNMLKSVGLDGNQSLFPNELSGGMQKRLGIARALIVKPEIILYDEPTAGLDPVTARQISTMVKKLSEETGSTVVMITNEVPRAYQISDRICLLASGKWLEAGTPEETKVQLNPVIKQFVHGNKDGPITSGLS